MTGPEFTRLAQDRARFKNWKRWGPYLSERQWGTVREDYSATGESWDYFPHDHARSRAYRWGEDGLLGICDREGRLCFAPALWNGKDPILKERLFGLGGTEGNHGEDIKEVHFHLDATPTHSYLKALYKYPQGEFPYAYLVAENRRRTKKDREFELLDTGIFDKSRYFDVFVEYAKGAPDDILIRLTIVNRGPETAPIHVLPSVWFRNTWSWGRTGEGYWRKGLIWQNDANCLALDHESLGRYFLASDEQAPFLFTENESNIERLFGASNRTHFVKDAFHSRVIAGEEDAVSHVSGTKAASWRQFQIAPGAQVQLRLRLWSQSEGVADPFSEFDETFEARMAEADDFYQKVIQHPLTPEIGRLVRTAYSGLLWTKQFYYYAVHEWLEGDPAQPPPPPERWDGRNHDWQHLYNRDVLSMPDAWEYPWYAAWDLAFHMVPFSQIDSDFAKQQLVLMLREWYMHPNGQIPAYEFGFSDVNPPVHAYACWRAYKMSGPRGQRDKVFLERTFQKLLLNFTWWVNRKDVEGRQVFSGGFLGLDNIGVFDRSKPLPGGGQLEQADGTAWMAFYCSVMLSMALELAPENPAYEDMASKFFEHFVEIADAMNTVGGSGLWDEDEGFYFDQLRLEGRALPLKLRSMVGIIPLFAVQILEQETIECLPGFRKRMEWFLENRRDLGNQISWLIQVNAGVDHTHRLLAIPSRERLARMLRHVFDEGEFLSPYGVRSLSKFHAQHPYELQMDGERWEVKYEPGESETGIFGGNSNWRGPIWFPVNFLLVEALERYGHFFGESFKVEFPTDSENWVTLNEASAELNSRLCRLFLPDHNGHIPWQGEMSVFREDPHWRGLTWFFEYFHGDNGRGCGANLQTGWTSLIARFLLDLGRTDQA